MIIVVKNGDPVPAVVCKKARKYKKTAIRNGKEYQWYFYKLDCFIPRAVAENAANYIVIPLTQEDIKNIEKNKPVLVEINTLTRVLKS